MRTNPAISTFIALMSLAAGYPAAAQESQSRSTVAGAPDDEPPRAVLTIVDGQVFATVNGERIPVDRIVRDGHDLRLLGGGGGAAGRIGLLQSIPATAPHVIGLPGETLEALREWARPEHPDVMLGVTMSDANPAILMYLRIEPPVGVVIEHVYDGLPADEAGLKEGDIIIAVGDGEDALTAITTSTLRAALATLEPGDSVHLTVLRAGDRMEFDVELAPYDAEALGDRLTTWSNLDAALNEELITSVHALRQGAVDLGRDGEQQLRGILEQLLTGLEDLDLADEAQQAVREALDELERADLDALRPRAFAPQLFTAKGDDMVFTVPAPPSPPGVGPVLQGQLGVIEARLDGIEEQLGRIESVLKKLADE